MPVQKSHNLIRRAAGAPPLPQSILRFILYCLSSFKGWLALMVILETGQAAGNILVPYAIKAIMDGVSKGLADAPTAIEALKGYVCINS